MAFALVLSFVLVAYNTIFNLRLPVERWYVPANLTALVGLVVVSRRFGFSWQQLGVTRFGSGLLWGVGIAVAVVAVIGLVVLVAGSTRPVERLLGDRRADVSRGQLVYQTLVRIPLGTALFEEVAFRGVLLAAFDVPLSRTGAVIASSVVFGVWHVAPTIDALYLNRVRRSSRVAGGVLAAVALTTLFGVGFCILRLLSGSVLSTVLAHWASNSVGILVAYVAQRRRPRLSADRR